MATNTALDIIKKYGQTAAATVKAASTGNSQTANTATVKPVSTGSSQTANTALDIIKKYGQTAAETVKKNTEAAEESAEESEEKSSFLDKAINAVNFTTAAGKNQTGDSTKRISALRASEKLAALEEMNEAKEQEKEQEKELEQKQEAVQARIAAAQNSAAAPRAHASFSGVSLDDYPEIKYSDEVGENLKNNYENLKNTYIEMDRGHVVTQAKEALENWQEGKFAYEQSKALDSLDEDTLENINRIVDFNYYKDMQTGIAVSGGIANYDSDIVADKKAAVQELLDEGYTQDEIDSLVEYQTYRRNAEDTAAMNAQTAEFATEHPILANAASVVLAPTQALGLTEFLNRRVNEYAPLDVNSPAFATVNAVNTTREQTSENIQNSVDNGKLGQTLSFLYQSGMSIADSATLIAAMGPASVYVMGTSAAANTAKDITERGGSVKQAFIGSVAAGAIEVLTEKFSVENLLENVSSPSVMKSMLRQAGVEASEEMTAEVLNVLADAANMGSRSNYQLSIEYYRDVKGMSEEDAKSAALLDVAEQVALSGAGGFLSGGVMAGAGGAINYAGARVSTESQLKNLVNNWGYQTASQYAGTVDNASGAAYNTNTEGGVLNGSAGTAAYNGGAAGGTELDGASDEGVLSAGIQKLYRGDSSGWNSGQGDISASGVVRLNSDSQSDRTAFSQALSEARNSNPANGWAVTPKSADELRGAQMFTLDNGSAGLAVASDGDIEAVFRNQITGAKRSMNQLIPLAIENGGTKLDCYGEGLVRVYERYGFIPVARVEFNEAYANPGWDESKGTPYIYFMIAGDTNAESVRQNIDNYKLSTIAELDALPTYGKEDYDAAYQYRDELLNRASGDIEYGQRPRLIQNSQENTTDAAGRGMTAPTGNILPEGQSAAETAGDGLGAADAGFDPYSHLQNQKSQFHDEGANAVRTVEVPTTDLKGRNISRTASTAMGAEVTNTEGVKAIEQAVADGNFSYFKITDSAAVEAANNTIRRKDWDAALNDWTSKVRQGKVSKDLIVLGQVLYNNALNSGNTKEAVRILTDYSAAVRSGAQATQAASMLRKLSPEYQLYSIQRNVDGIADSIRERFPDIDITLSEELQAQYLEATDDFERQAALKAIYKSVAEQIPSTWADKWNSWRYLSMLANFRTHIRNISGNLVFMPARIMKNALGSGIEAAVNKVSRNGIERTKAVLNITNASDRALLKAAWYDYAEVSDQILAGGKYNDVKSEIDNARTIFKNNGTWGTTEDSSAIAKGARKLTDFAWKALDTVNSINSTALEVEDAIFSKSAYAESLAGWLKANGVTAEDVDGTTYLKSSGEITQEMIDKARAYAIKEAQKATYRDFNDFSDWVSNLGRNYTGTNKVAKAVNTLVEGVLPFKRTPANILVRAYEYSPVELAKGLTYDLAQVKNGNMTAADAIDHIASGLTGTAILGLGVLLSRLGLLIGGSFGDDDDDQIAENAGRQEYALEVGNKSYTLDWLAPTAIPMFVGAELYNLLTDKSEGGVTLDNVLDGLMSITQPLMEMSMLDSLSDLLDNITYADNKTFSILSSAATSYITQAFPTLFGQIERSTEENRESTWVDRTSQIPTSTQVILGKVMNKLPGEYQQYEYIDAWGRTESSGSNIQRIFNNLLNPSYVSELSETEVDTELKRLKEAGIDVYIPSRVATSTKIDGEYLTVDEYSAYATKLGTLRYDLYNDLIHSDAYRALDDDSRNDALNAMNDYAKSVAGDLVRSMRGTEQKDEYANVEDLSDVSVYTAFKEAMDRGKSKGSWTDAEALFDSGVEVPDDVAEALGSDYTKNKAVYDAGIDLAEYHDIKDAFSSGYTAATDEDEETVPDYTAIDAAIDAYNSLKAQQRSVIDDVIGSTNLSKAAGAVKRGIDSETWFDIVNTYQDINDKDMGATAKQTELEHIIDVMVGLTTGQKEYAKDTLTYYSIVGAEANKYNALKEAGLSSDGAERVYELAQNAPTIYSTDSAGTSEQAVYIAQSKLGDEQKLQALSTYFNDGVDGTTYKRCVSAMEQGYSIAQFTRFWYEYNNAAKNEDYENYSSKKNYLYAWGAENGYNQQAVNYLYYLMTHSVS